VFVLGCAGAQGTAPPPAGPASATAPSAASATTTPPAPVSGAAATAPATPARPLDASAIGAGTGANPEVADKVVQVSFPRNDVSGDAAAFAKMPPFMSLTSWAAFEPAEKPGVEAMVMGDIVLFEDEVGPAMSAALDRGLEVTALHNHFFYDKPR